jgi:hypothetical protein
VESFEADFYSASSSHSSFLMNPLNRFNHLASSSSCDFYLFEPGGEGSLGDPPDVALSDSRALSSYNCIIRRSLVL